MLKYVIPLSLRNKLRPWKNPFHACAMARIQNRAGKQVCSGPFAGMRFGFEDPDPPKLLGTYELEIHDTIRLLSDQAFHTIINVGAGEGYYAVGLARMIRTGTVYAFEANSAKHELIRRLAEDNGVGGRIKISGLCTVADLASVLSNRPPCLVVMDVEGAEGELLNPELIGALRTTWILVEKHDVFCPGISREISARFKQSHVETSCDSVPRLMADFPIRDFLIRLLPDKDIVALMNESRPGPMSWSLLVPNDATKASL
jgi:hypothetical protein